jgi:hypothetical protein
MSKKSAEARAVEQAEFDRLVAHEKKMIDFREGRLGFWESEQIASELCAAGDLERRREAERTTREAREAGARARAGVI